VRKKKTRAFSTKAKYNSKCHRSTIAKNAIASNLAKKIEGSLTVGTSRA